MHRHAGGADLVEHEVGLGGAVEHELESELLLQPQRGHDLGRGLRGDQQRHLAAQHLGERVEREVARRAAWPDRRRACFSR